MSGRGNGGKAKRRPYTPRFIRANVWFPVARIHRYLRKRNYAKRFGALAPVYKKERKIFPRHINVAVRNDEELNKLMAGVTITGGGVLPNNHSALLPTAEDG
ncbi:hypothetical protein CAEBREN_05422 [Caenorhabditis brenneri]|uniref:Histone H2A n=1 Tax=Caenorhabditis brenneri TaxID=135651 RepID=G0NDA7_CAEBE|nr:hypothetical protein CAEBREN_05422 [Caenorhabditis brenneri]